MRSPISGATCSGHTQRKRLLIFLCVFVWFAIFFVSGTLFVKRRYGITDELASLSSSFQEQIDKLSNTVNEHKTSAQNVIKGLHQEMNTTMARLGERIQELKIEFMERRQKAINALNALHGYQLKATAPSTVMSTSLPRSDMRPNASVELCVDSMEKQVGSDVDLFACHSDGGDQAWSLAADGRIKNKKLNFCLRGGDVSDGSSVITAYCHENDGLQKWRLSNHLLAVDEYSDKCLDADLSLKKLVIKLCDSKKLSQHWLV